MDKLEKIIEGVEKVDDINDCYYNPEDGEIFFSNIGEYTELNEDELDDLFMKSIILPTRYEINEYQMMIDFIETINDETVQEKLSSLIQGKGAFRRFKDYCIEANIIQDWYNFRHEKYKEIAIDWCKRNNLEFI